MVNVPISIVFFRTTQNDKTRIVKMDLQKKEMSHQRVSREQLDLFHFLRCPYCLSHLEKDSHGAYCRNSKETFHDYPNGILDLRLSYRVFEALFCAWSIL
jgi:hypothetical protein